MTMGFLRVLRDAHLLDETGSLNVARRMVVVIVEPDLSQRDHLGMVQQTRPAADKFLP